MNSFISSEFNNPSQGTFNGNFFNPHTQASNGNLNHFQNYTNSIISNHNTHIFHNSHNSHNLQMNSSFINTKIKKSPYSNLNNNSTTNHHNHHNHNDNLSHT